MQASKFVASYFDAWNHADPAGVADHLTTDGVYIDVPENTPRTHDELVVNLRSFFADFPHRYELIGEILTGTDTIAFQYRIHPAGEKSKAEPGFRGAEFMTLSGDNAVTITDYYDLPLAARTGKYAKSGLKREQLHEYMRRLDEIMENRQAYLKSNLTLPVLASLVGCSVNHLSQVINAGYATSFFDYVNRYRVRHARRLLLEACGKDAAVLNIAFSVGFNSNSAFYTAFRKHVGMTPAAFRRSQRQ